MNAKLETTSKFRVVVQEWNPNFTKVLHRPKNKKEYEALCEFSYAMSEKLEDNADKDMQALLDIVILLIEQYQNEHYAYEDVEPVAVLKTFMEEQNLVQNDLRNEIGSQGIVSEVLRGKRKINLKMAKALAKRFNTSVELFI